MADDRITMNHDDVDAQLRDHGRARAEALAAVAELTKEAPPDLNPNTLDAGALGMYYDQCGAWHEHLLRLQAKSQLSLRAADKQLGLIEAYLSAVLFAGTKEKDKAALIVLNPDYASYDLAREAEAAMLGLLDAHVDAMSRRIARISRHITLRQGQQGITDRRSNVLGTTMQGHGPPPPRVRK
jgi:hypothetical protein